MKPNIILFAAGGGNDIFSTITYAKNHLTDYNKIAIIGLLGFTPFHHSNTTLSESQTEQPLIIPNENMRRYLFLDPLKEIYCMEKLLPEILLQVMPSIQNYVCVSPKYSAKNQAINLQKLFNEWAMLRKR